MVNQSQLDAVKKLVQASGHLSPKERDEWLSLLPFMSDKQLSDLAAILQSQGPELQAPRQTLTSQGSKPQPELPAAPMELDLPAPQASSVPPARTTETAPKQRSTDSSVGSGPGANSVSDFINRNFAATLHRSPVASSGQAVKPQPAEATSAQKQTPIAVVAPVAAAVPEVKTVPKPVAPVSAPVGAPEQPISVSDETAGFSQPPTQAVEEVVPTPKTLEDIRRLNTATLRGRGVLTIEAELKVLCKKFGYFSVLFALEHSPLYQTYTAVGARVLKDGQSFERAQESLANDGRPYLTKPEFEEVNDVLQRIKSA